jgi:TetR/AcrR family transcriptional repressor of nem operon
MCQCSFMAAEYDDLPEPVKKVSRQADGGPEPSSPPLPAASSSRGAAPIISFYDALIESYRVAGLLPA